MSKKWLNRWCLSAAALTLIGIALASADLPLDTPGGIAFRILYGLIAAAVAIGFYLYMFAACLSYEQGWLKRVLVLGFLLLPILFAFVYYWLRPFGRELGKGTSIQSDV
jgi:hypothetical protein